MISINDPFKVKPRFHQLSHDQAIEIAYDKSVSTNRRIEKYIIIKSDYMNDFWFTETNEHIARELQMTVNTVALAIARLIKDRIIAREIHPKDKRIRILLWMDSVHYWSTRILSKMTLQDCQIQQYNTVKNDIAPLVTVLDPKIDNTLPISLSTPNPNPSPLRGAREFDGLSEHELMELFYWNMGISRDEFLKRRRENTLTPDQKRVEQMAINGKIMFEGQARRFPKHLRENRDEHDNGRYIRRKQKK